MVTLLAVGLLLGAVPGERMEETADEPVGFLLMADLGALPKAVVELEAPINPMGSAFIALGYPIPIGLNLTGRLPGPQVTAGWRTFLFGRGPWGLFIDGRVLAHVYFPSDPMAPSPIVIPGGGLTAGLNAKLWHVVISPGVSLLYIPDPAATSYVLPALRLAVGGWN